MQSMPALMIAPAPDRENKKGKDRAFPFIFSRTGGTFQAPPAPNSQAAKAPLACRAIAPKATESW